MSHHADPDWDLDDDDDEDRDPADLQLQDSRYAQDNRHTPVIGPAFDPYEDRPEERLRVLAPLLAHDDGGLHRAPAGLSTGSGSEKLEFLLQTERPADLVQALAPEELVFLIRDIGLEDASELLGLASPRQLQACVDLDVWRGHELDTERFLHWLAVAQSESRDVADRFVASQEDGLLCLLLARHLKVVPVHDDMEAEIPDDVDVFDSPDGSFKLYGDPDTADLGALRGILEALYRLDLHRGRAVIRAMQWELDAQLEDDLAGLRAARLADLGMMGRDEALEIYTYMNPHAHARALHDAWRGTEPAEASGATRPYLPSDEETRLGLALREREVEGSFLRSAFAHVPAEQRERVHNSLIRLVYRIQCGRSERIAAIDEMATWSRHALRTLAMGLQHASGDDTRYAGLLLTHVPAAELFQAGHSLVVIEVYRARRLRKALGGADGLELLEPSDQSMVRGLLALHPVVYEGEIKRPVEQLSELTALARRLQTLTVQVGWMTHVSGGGLLEMWRCLPVNRRPRLTTLFNTAVAWQLLTGEAQWLPLGATQVRDLMGQLLDGAGIRPELRAGLTGSVLAHTGMDDEQAQALTEFVGDALDRMASDLGGLRVAAEVDLRFVGDALWVHDDQPS